MKRKRLRQTIEYIFSKKVNLLILFFNLLRIKYRRQKWKIYKALKATIIYNTKQGKYKFKVINHSVVEKDLYVSKSFEIDIINGAMTLLKELYNIDNKMMIDIGANNGVIAISMLLKNYFNRVICIEPDPDNFNYLQTNVNLNSLNDKVDMFNIALSDKNEVLQFELSKTNFGDHRIRNKNVTNKFDTLFDEDSRKVINVDSMTLDKLVSKNSLIKAETSLIWMDIQGYEPNVFLGAKDFYRNVDKVIPVVTEFWPYGMKRLGVTKEKCLEIYSSIFSHFFAIRRDRYFKYDINHILQFYDELDYKDLNDNIILVNENKL